MLTEPLVLQKSKKSTGFEIEQLLFDNYCQRCWCSLDIIPKFSSKNISVNIQIKNTSIFYVALIKNATVKKKIYIEAVLDLNKVDIDDWYINGRMRRVNYAK